ncbi:MAG TPA: hypothetical protein VN043_16570 [Rhodanobacter sp.]|nr:hypothetical protein [Rhodanobacter sp.]
MSRIPLRALSLAIACAFISMPAFAGPVPAKTPAAGQKGPFAELHFRDLGPAVAGGRVAAAVGIPGDPLTYYAGAAAGGVWKTSDGGEHWKPIFEHEASASIGAIALAPSNPNLVWVGTGESNIRNDIVDGAGVYLSTDAGKSFKRMGLDDAGQIGQILVDPHNPDHVLVAALGHAWGPNAERGVFETTDGGKSWKKTLFVDNQTGAIDMAMAPGNPQVLFASTWQVVRHPWNLADGGKGSGLWRSTDGGANWSKLTDGLPKGSLGRIAVATAPSDPQRVYSLVETKPGEGLLFVSHDLGDKWTEVSDNHALDVRPFYFSRFVVSPVDADKLYFMSFHLMESDDGGKTAHVADKEIHPDHHALWIDPTNPKRILQGNDGGIFLSQDSGKSWRFLDGLPIEQDYMVAADGGTPYLLCAGLQDNAGWCGPSSTLADHVLGATDWFNVVGGDGQYVVPAGKDYIYNDAQDGAISVFHRHSKRSVFAMPYLHGPGFINDLPLATAKYRFNWTTPIAVDPQDPDTAYAGANVIFKTTDAGQSWTPISGDLTRNDKEKQALSGGQVNLDLSGAESYDTVLSLSIAPSDPQVLWAGTDDGLVQVTRDGGAHWTNVTPGGAPKWARVYQVGVSASEPGHAYVGFDAHELDDRHAYVYRTDNFGKSWTRIDKGLPDAPVSVVREDPDHPGVLVAGTDIGAWVSRDNGDHWSKLGAHFPTTPVVDVKFVQGDLVLATHGRGIFVFDHFAPLAEYSDSIAKQPLHLFTPRAGMQLVRWSRGEGAEPLYTVPNAPNGVIIDYSVPKAIKAGKDDKHGAVTLTVRDGAGKLIATRYTNARPGVNRYVWNMQYDGATRLDFDKPQSDDEDKDKDGNNSHGPMVLPGTYQLTVSADGHHASESVQVKADPNQKPAPQAEQAILQHALVARAQLSAVNDMLNRVTSMRATLKQFEDKAGDDSHYTAAMAQAKKLDRELGSFRDSIYAPGVQHAVVEDDLKQLSDLQGSMAAIAGYGFSSLEGQMPTPALLEMARQLGSKVDAKVAQFNALLSGDVASYNHAAYAAGAPTLMTGEPETMAAAP